MRVRIEFELIVPDDTEMDQVEEWVKYNLDNGEMDADNPLIDLNPSPQWISVEKA